MGKQTERIAYGRPDFGGIVIGGENNTFYSLGEDWTDESDGDGVTITTSFWVHGTDSEIEERIAALDALLQEKGNLGITGADKSSFVGDLSLSSRDVVLTTTAATPFTEEMVGLPIDVENIGSFQISEFVSGSQVKCLHPNPLTLPSAASGLNFSMGIVFRQHAETLKTGGYNGRGRWRHVPDEGNEPNRRRFELVIKFISAAEEYRGVGNNRQKANIKWRNPVGGERSAIFTGTYTAADSTDALAIYNSEVIGYVAANMLALLGSGVSWEKVGEDVVDFDDNKSLVSYTIIRKEINTDQSLAEFNHPALSDANITIQVAQDNVHGLSGIVPPPVFALSYNCVLVRGEYTNETAKDLWFETVYPNLASLVELIQKSSIIVVRNVHSFNTNTARLTGSIVGVLPDAGDSVIRYQRTVSYRLNRRNKYRDVWNGRVFSVIKSSPGPMVAAVVTVQYSELLVSKRSRRSTDIFGQGQAGQLFGNSLSGGLGLFGIGQGIKITIDDNGDSEGEGNQSFKPLDPPASAKEFYAKYGIEIEDAKWDDNGITIDVTPISKGNDPTGISSEAIENVTTITRVWRWVNLESQSSRGGAAPVTGGGTSGGASGGTTTTTGKAPNPGTDGEGS